MHIGQRQKQYFTRTIWLNALFKVLSFFLLFIYYVFNQLTSSSVNDKKSYSNPL